MARSVGYGRSRWMDRASIDLANAAADREAKALAMAEAREEAAEVARVTAA